MLYEFSVYMANDMIMPSMLHVTKDFHASSDRIPTSLSIFLLGGSSLQLFIGPLSDRVGRRKVMLVGVATFLVSTFFIAFSYSMETFFMGRFLQGTGLCFISVIGYAALQELYEEKTAIRLISLMAIVSLLAPLLGPIVGGVFIEFFHWRFVFLFIGILAAISYVGLGVSMPETAHFQYTDDKSFVKKLPAFCVPNFKIKDFMVLYLNLLKDKKFVCGAFIVLDISFSFGAGRKVSHNRHLVWPCSSPFVWQYDFS